MVRVLTPLDVRLTANVSVDRPTGEQVHPGVVVRGIEP